MFLRVWNKMECPSCGSVMGEGDRICSVCEFKLDLKRIDYLIERSRGGKFLYSNFEATREVGAVPFSRIKSIRPGLGDKVHVLFFVLRFLSMTCVYPLLIYDFYKLGKLLGYYAIEDLPPGVFKHLSSVLRKSEIDILGNRLFQKIVCTGWKRVGGGILEFIDFDEKKGRLRYRLSNSAIFSSDEKLIGPACFIQLGTLCGVIEAISGKFCEGVETKCAGMGDPRCEFDLFLQEGEGHPRFGLLSKGQLEMSLDFVIEMLIEEKKNLRGNAGDYVHMSLDQSLNYMILSLSRGHLILSKWSGRVVGEKLMERKGIGSIFDALDYLQVLFMYLKAGVLEKEFLSDVLRVKIMEPAYSSGVKDIHMKLCAFIAGILEGSLRKSSREVWRVEETKCIATGYGFCEFECTTEEPATLKRLLLG